MAARRIRLGVLPHRQRLRWPSSAVPGTRGDPVSAPGGSRWRTCADRWPSGPLPWRLASYQTPARYATPWWLTSGPTWAPCASSSAPICSCLVRQPSGPRPWRYSRMTANRYQDLPAAMRRRTVLRTVLRGFLSTQPGVLRCSLLCAAPGPAVGHRRSGAGADRPRGLRRRYGVADQNHRRPRTAGTPACGSCSGPYAGARNAGPIRTRIPAPPPARDNSPHADEVSAMIPGHGG